MKKTLQCAIIAFCFIILAAKAAFAASFTATVDRTDIPPGESVTLELNVSGAEPKDPPDLSPLDGDFTVVSRGQTSQTDFLNGQMTSSTGWNIVLMPKKDGALTIPALSVDTDGGTLKSDAITLNVGKATAGGGGGAGGALSVDAQVSEHDPYQNEPVLLTVKLTARKSIGDVGLPEMTIDNAIVEPQGKPQVHETVVDGTHVAVVEMKYLVTPLQPGPLQIPAPAFHGKIETSQRPSGDTMDPFNMPDPFTMLEEFNNLPGFGAMKPFAISGPAITLDVKKPAAQMNPWLPLESLKAGDEWDDTQKPRVGEPLTRKLTLAAIGATGAVLPGLESRIDPSGDFKIYADKPVTGQSLRDDGKVSGWRQESYTLIPQKEGKLTLPEIRVAWWDIDNNKVAYAVVPGKTLDVAPGAAGTQAAQASAPAAPPPEKAAAATPPAPAPEAKTSAEAPQYFHIILAGLCGVIAVLAGLVIHLQLRLSRRKPVATVAPAPVSANEDKLSLNVLNRSMTLDEMRQFLQAYAHQEWRFPPNTALKTIAQELDRFVTGDKLTAARSCLADIDAALYAGKTADVEDIRARCYAALKGAGARKAARETPAKYGSLNPS